MSILRAFLKRLLGLHSGQQREQDFKAELDSHIQLHTEENIRSGMSPEAAQRDAILKLGGLEPTRQAYRERGTIPFLETILQDVRFALRQLIKNPGFTITAIIIFALGIAASTAIFTFVDAALIRPLPYARPAQLVGLFEHIPIGDRYHISYGDYLDWKKLNHVFSSLDIYERDSFTLTATTGKQQASGARVSDGFFRTLGVSPVIGRDFLTGEDLPHSPRTVMLSYEAWQKRYAADRSVVGRTITLDGVPYVIIGVLPSGFHFALVEPADFWATIHGDCSEDRNCHRYYGIARLKRGVQIQTALADIDSISKQIASRYPLSNRDRSATVLPLEDLILGDVRPILITLLSGSGLLLLIGFVNVSSLLIVRTESRRQEIAIRGALGASQSRLIRQFVVEGFLLSAVGSTLGLVIALSAIRGLIHQIPVTQLDKMPYLKGLNINVHAVIFAIVISIAGGIFFSAAPALQLFLSEMQESLAEGGRPGANRSWSRIGSHLVVAELAIAMVLLASACLLGESFYRLLHVDIGMSAEHLAVLHVFKPDAATQPQSISMARQILLRMQALPGVTSAGISEQPAIGDGDGLAYYYVAGKPFLRSNDEANDRMASVGYFETLRARLIQGRFFTDRDDASKPLVAVINRTMANQSFAAEDPIGKHILNQYDLDSPMEVIGVIEDVKEGPLEMKPRAAVYRPFNQNPTNNFYVTLRTTQSEDSMLPSMVRAVHQIDAGLIADGEDTMKTRINNSQSAYLHRSAASLVGGFAILALLLGTIGLYGVIAYSVSQRTREIGVRMALGAQRASVYQLILKEGARLAICGIAIGIVCSLGATMLLRSMLFGVHPWDIATLATVALVLAAASLLASYIPARRAASINPTEALRAE